MEDHVVTLVVSSLSEQGYKLRCEVPNMGQSADIVATRGRWVTFIEAKISDWRTALRQCHAHELVADYVCIALASVEVSQACYDLASERGYGIIHCNMKENTCRWALAPKRNQNVWKPQRRHLAMQMKAIGYAH